MCCSRKVRVTKEESLHVHVIPKPHLYKLKLVWDKINRTINPIPPKQEKRREGAKTRHFSIIETGEGVFQMFHLFCTRLQLSNECTCKETDSNSRDKTQHCKMTCEVTLHEITLKKLCNLCSKSECYVCVKNICFTFYD